MKFIWSWSFISATKYNTQTIFTKLCKIARILTLNYMTIKVNSRAAVGIYCGILLIGWKKIYECMSNFPHYELLHYTRLRKQFSHLYVRRGGARFTQMGKLA